MPIRSSSRKCRRRRICAGRFIVWWVPGYPRASSTGFGSKRQKTTSLSMQGRRRVAKGRRVVAHAGATVQTIRNVSVDRMETNNGAAAKGLERDTTQQLYGELLGRFE